MAQNKNGNGQTEVNAQNVQDVMVQTQNVTGQPEVQAPAEQKNTVMLEVTDAERKRIERGRKAKKVLIPVGIGLGAAIVGFVTGRVTSKKETEAEQEMFYGTAVEPGQNESTSDVDWS